MNPMLLNLVGKWDSQVPYQYHPLLYHLLDVGHVARMLWESSVGEAQKYSFCTIFQLDSKSSKNWACFLAAIHDLGKASPSFQIKNSVQKEKLDANGYDFCADAKHGPAHGVITAYELRNYPEIRNLHDDCYEAYDALGRIVGGHHGILPALKEFETCDFISLGKNKIWSQSRIEILEYVAAYFQVELADPPKIDLENSAEVIALMGGITTISDWIGSISDSFPFAYEITDLDAYIQLSRKRSETVLSKTGWNHTPVLLESQTFQQIFGFTPRPLQILIESYAQTISEPVFMIMEVPMGEGKTEAALTLMDYIQVRLKGQGCYFGLPTMATSNQMFGRVTQYLRKRYRKNTVNVNLLHGRSKYNPDLQEIKLKGIYEGNTNSKDEDNPLQALDWFSQRKRGLLSSYGVGTIDQVLMAGLNTRHFFVRLYALANKTIILDEVHAYDAYMLSLLSQVLQWLRTFHTSVIVLSATLPNKIRQKLVNAYAGAEMDMPEAQYPSITAISKGMVTRETISNSKHQQVQLDWIPSNYIVAKIAILLKEGGCCAIICNTVASSQYWYQQLLQSDVGQDEELELFLFHARFPYEDRQNIENEILKRFGKEGDRPAKAIVVATQVIEQSLDIDFDLMISELAPVDLLLQRLGRLHRHEGNHRPEKLSNPILHIILDKESTEALPELNGSKYVYEPYILYRSYLTLRHLDTIFIPDNMENLIEQVYDDEQELSLPEGHKEYWKTALEDSKRDLHKHLQEYEHKAQLVKINSPERLESCLNQFNLNLQEDKPDVHEQFQAVTRLGPSTISLIVLHENKPETIDLEQPELNSKTVEKLLKKEITVSNPKVVNYFKKQKVPKSWQKHPSLRYSRPAIFDSTGRLDLGTISLQISKEMGLLYWHNKEL